nr:immunoglobulin heavy chain junction region [Mus musculus]
CARHGGGYYWYFDVW